MTVDPNATNVAPKNAWVDCHHIESPDLFAKAEAFAPELAAEIEAGIHFFRRPLESATADHRVMMRDPFTGQRREMVMFGSNAYLGLARHPKVVRALTETAATYGVGTASAPLLSGTTDLHLQLERTIAAFYRCEDALLFPAGYMANLGAIAGLIREGDVVVNDQLNHASIVDGSKLAGGGVVSYPHNNMRRLERALQRVTGPTHGTLVVTDGVFSMEGSVCQLPRIVELCKEYGARLLLDEAHALGVVGPTGRGTAEIFGLEGRIDLTIGTLSKATGGVGGYVAGSKAVIDYLRYYARSYIFSNSIPTPIVAALLAAFEVMETEPEHYQRLRWNVRTVTGRLRELGFDIGPTESAIIPLMVRDEDKLRALLKELHEAGIFTNYVSYPAVPLKRCRLRISIMAHHTDEDIQVLLSNLERLGRQYALID